MADFLPEARAAFLAGLLCLALPAAAATPRAAAPRSVPPRPAPHGVLQTDPACSQDIVVESDAAESAVKIDSRANRLTILAVTITQCTLSIRADKAIANGTGVSFNNSTWEFTGAVNIRFATGSLQSAAATVRFVGNRIAQARATGTPAEFEQKLDNLPRPVHGHAGSIDYDFVAQTVRLDGEAFLFDGRNDMTNESIAYSIKDQVAQLSAAPGGRVRITIRPEASSDTPATPAAPVPAAAPPGSQK